MTVYTPGPWLLDGVTVYALQAHRTWGRKPEFVNRFSANLQPGVDSAGNRTPEAELQTNARLMHAAPDLFEACREAMLQIELLQVMLQLEAPAKEFPADGIGKDVLTRGYAAIARATGDQP
jgi:hypothetical protein